MRRYQENINQKKPNTFGIFSIVMYLLLDTNILVGFLTDPHERYLIDRLESLLQLEEFQLLVPVTLKNEWQDKRKQELQRIRKNFSEVKQRLSNDSSIDSQLQDELRIVNERADRIEAFLNNGISIELSDAVKIRTSDRKMNNLPPFRSVRSYNDGLIFFSAIEYLKQINEKEYCFVTKDRDFCNPNLKDQFEPDLMEKDLEVFFSLSLEKMIRILVSMGKIKDEQNVTNAEQGITIEVVRRKKMNFLDYLYEVLVVCQKKMRMIPPHIFCKIEPFRISNTRFNYSDYGQYVLHTNNDELIEFFINVEIDEQKFKNEALFPNSDENIRKLKYILEVLNRHLVFVIKKFQANDSVNIRPKNDVVCYCTRCLFSRFDWKQLADENYVSDDDLKLAFVHFQLGFYEKSFRGYYACYERAVQDKNKILAYQLQYTLEWVRFYLKSDKDAQLQVMVDRVKEFNNEKDFFSFASAPAIDREIARFYYEGKVLSHFDKEIGDTLAKIKGHYQSQLRASFSSNSHYMNLSTDYSVFIEFTFSNCLPFTKYSDFLDISKSFTEGTFLSYALNEYQPSRLQEFTEFELATLLRYGNAEQMSKLYANFVRRKIAQEQVDEPFDDLAKNLLANGRELILKLEKEAWEGSLLLYSSYWNLLVILSIVEFREEIIIECFDGIIPFLELLPRRETTRLHLLALFIRKNSKTLGKERLKRLFNVCVNNAELHNEHVFEAFSALPKKGLFDVISSQEEYELLIKYFGEKCSKCNEYHQNVVYFCYFLLDTELGKKLADQLNKNLSEIFDINTYCMAAIYEIIDYRVYFDKCMSLFQKPGNRQKHPFYEMEGPIGFRELNNFMNVVFKYGIQLPDDFVNKLRGISDYYDWLLDMKDFDYSKFNPLWINYYATIYYLKTIFSLEIIRQKVQTFLRTFHQPTLAFYYTQHVLGTKEPATDEL
jgi:hypothetical protein